jgi:hypothetical protein
MTQFVSFVTLIVEMCIAPLFYTWVSNDVKRISIAKNKNTENTTLCPEAAFDCGHNGRRCIFQQLAILGNVRQWPMPAWGARGCGFESRRPDF